VTAPVSEPRAAGTPGPERDLALVVRDAWSVIRLARLHEIVQRTVDDLAALSPRDLLGREVTAMETTPAVGPIALALAACREELRFEAGVVRSAEGRESVSRDVRRIGARFPEGWTATYVEALAEYRRVAGRLLKVRCDAASA